MPPQEKIDSRKSTGQNYQILFLILFIVTLAFKLSTISKPFLGYFASYQVVSGMVSKFYAMENFSNLFLPKAFYLIHGEPAVILLFFPLDAALAALGYKMMGLTVDFWGRFWGIFFSTLSILLFYKVLRRTGRDREESYLASSLFMLFPVVTVTGQCFMHDNSALFFFLLGYLVIVQSRRLSFGSLFIGCFLASLSFVIRIHFVFLLPLLLAEIIFKERKQWRLNLALGLFFLLALPALWVGYVYLESPKHAGLHTSLFSQIAEKRRFLINSDFLMRFPGRLWGGVMSPFGFILTVLGLATDLRTKNIRRFYVWLLCGFSIALVLPQKALDHPFYLLPMLPAAAFFSARAYRILKEKIFKSTRVLVFFILCHFLVFLRFIVGPLYVDMRGAATVMKTARILKEISESKDMAIVSHGLDSGVLYYADRFGWHFKLEGNSSELIDRFKNLTGSYPVKFYVAGERSKLEEFQEFYRYLKYEYPVLHNEPEFVIFDLRNGN